MEKGESVQLVVNSDASFPNWEFPCKLDLLNWLDPEKLDTYLRVFELENGSKAKAFYVDSYLAHISHYLFFKEHCEELICIDDAKRIEYPIGSTILNPGYPGLFLDYDSSKYKIITGKEQVLLRKPFRENFEIPNRNYPPKNVLVTLGGADPNLYSEKILEFLILEYPNLEKHFVIGPGFLNEDFLRKIADENTFFYKNLSAIQMRDLMIQMDFAITAGGQTTYELDRCKVPMVMIKTAENQVGNIRGFVEFSGYREISEPSEFKIETCFS